MTSNLRNVPPTQETFVTTHQDNVGEDILASTINDLADSANVSSGILLNHQSRHSHGGLDPVTLNQSDSHGSPDTNASTSALHHTLGTGANQAAAGNHTHSIPFQFGPGFPAPAAGNVSQRLRITFATTITAFYAKRTGGTGATVDVQKNGVSILTTPISLTGTSWASASLSGTPTLAIGDEVQILVTGVTGSVTDIGTSLEGTRTIQ